MTTHWVVDYLCILAVIITFFFFTQDHTIRKSQLYGDAVKLRYWLEEALGPSVIYRAYASNQFAKGHRLIIVTKGGITYYSSETGRKQLEREFRIALPGMARHYKLVVIDANRWYYNEDAPGATQIYPEK